MLYTHGYTSRTRGTKGLISMMFIHQKIKRLLNPHIQLIRVVGKVEYLIRYTNLFKEFVNSENLYKGYRLARLNKRFKPEVLRYSANLEDNLIRTQRALLDKTYVVSNMHEFIEYVPKKRIITVMPFENRVVNCAAYLVLFPLFQKSFYEHSYGSIPGRGPLKAVDQLQSWLQHVKRRSDASNWYTCKMDISKFFFRIPFDVQLGAFRQKINDDDMMWFLETAIRCDGRAFGLPIYAKDVTTCERIPGIGMQVGSLISQMTANIVMNPVDHFIKRVLQVPYYLRYMDDMLFLAPSKEFARNALEQIRRYLNIHLSLELNSKTRILPISQPIEFVGKVVTSSKITMRKTSSLRMKHHLKYIMEHYSNGEIDLDYALAAMRSYLGYLHNCDCPELLNKVVHDFKLVRNTQLIQEAKHENIIIYGQ